MSTNKRFYWLKLVEDFFEQREIKKLRMIAGGDTYTIIYLKLQLLSLENSGEIYFEATEKDIYEQLHFELDEKIDDIKMTILFLKENRLIDIKEQDLSFIETKQLIGVTTAGALRVRRHRERKKEMEQQNKIEDQQQETLHCNTQVTNGNGELELELELDKEIEIELLSENNNNYLENNSNNEQHLQQQPISFLIIEEIFKNLELKSNPNEFYKYYENMNWKFHNGKDIKQNAIQRLALNWEKQNDKYLSENRQDVNSSGQDYGKLGNVF